MEEMRVIDLTDVRAVLKQVAELVRELDGKDLDETDAVSSQSKSNTRVVKAKRSQDLNLLATRLELAAQLVRNEYWFARGETDPLDSRRQR